MRPPLTRELVVWAVLMTACAQTRQPMAPARGSGVHFQNKGTASFRVLTLQGVVDRKLAVLNAATTESDYHSLWNNYGLKGHPAPVDFRSEFVVLFTEKAFCNDGQLTRFSLTSQGEIIPGVTHSERVCNLLATSECPHARIYVAALPLRYFPSGSYRLRHGTQVSSPFELVVAQGQGPRVAIAEAMPTVPEASPGTEFHHPRRAVVQFGPARREFGVWVRDDAVWLPPLPYELRELEPLEPESLCDSAGCVPHLVMSSCAAPECPDYGRLVIAQRPMGARAPWPAEPGAWAQLMLDLRRDAALSAILRPTLRYSTPAPEPKPTIGWAASSFTKRVVEMTAAADVGVFGRSGAGFVGPSLRFGLRNTRPANDTTSDGTLREIVAGDSWGFDLHLFDLQPFDGGRGRAWYGAGIAPGANNVLGPATARGRIRTQSLLGLIIPEIGLAQLPGDRLRPYLAHGIPFTFLLTQQLALDARPAFTLRTGPTSTGGSDALLSLSIGLMWRFPHTRCP